MNLLIFYVSFFVMFFKFMSISYHLLLKFTSYSNFSKYLTKSTNKKANLFFYRIYSYIESFIYSFFANIFAMVSLVHLDKKFLIRVVV